MSHKHRVQWTSHHAYSLDVSCVQFQYRLLNGETEETSIHTHLTYYYIHLHNLPIQNLVPANHLVRT